MLITAYLYIGKEREKNTGVFHVNAIFSCLVVFFRFIAKSKTQKEENMTS